MSKSHKTAPTRVLAGRRSSQSPFSLRIREISPPQGDIHPLNKKQVTRIVSSLPQDYLYGLKGIELRPRSGKLIGRPYGEYLNSEKKIRLYSVPYPSWVILNNCDCSLLEAHGAKVQMNGKVAHVQWVSEIDLAYFMYREVFLHELGHHYQNQYRSKKPHPKTPKAKEVSAERHKKVLSKLTAFQSYFDE